MNKNGATENKKTCANEWGRVYADAQRAMEEAQLRVKKLRRSLNWIRRQIQDGKPFPSLDDLAADQTKSS